MGDWRSFKEFSEWMVKEGKIPETKQH